MNSKIVFGMVLAVFAAACTATVDGTNKEGGPSPFDPDPKKPSASSSSGGSSSSSSGGSSSGGSSSGGSSSGGSSSSSSGGGAGCKVDGNASACGTCAAKSCCDQLIDCQNDQACSQLNGCVAECQDQSCTDACVQQYPQGKQLLMGVYECLSGKCSTQCGG